MLSTSDNRIYLSTSTGAIYAWDITAQNLAYLGTTEIALTDIAISPGGEMYGITETSLYSIDTTSWSATEIGSLEATNLSVLTGATAFDIAPDGTARIASDDTNSVVDVDLSTGAISTMFAEPLSFGTFAAGDMVHTSNAEFIVSTNKGHLAIVQDGSTDLPSTQWISGGNVTALFAMPVSGYGKPAGTLVGIADNYAYTLDTSEFAFRGSSANIETLATTGTITGAAVHPAAFSLTSTPFPSNPLFPTLTDTVELDATAVNGMGFQDSLTGETGKSFVVEIQNVGFAAYDNTLGYYSVDASGAISGVSVLTLDASAAVGETFTISNIDAGDSLGFFLIQDAAASLAGLTAADTLAFVNSAGDAANTSDGSNIAFSWNSVISSQDVFHSYSRTLNSDGLEHIVSGVSTDASTLFIGFEDLTGGGDNDFEDVVISVEIL